MNIGMALFIFVYAYAGSMLLMVAGLDASEFRLTRNMRILALAFAPILILPLLFYVTGTTLYESARDYINGTD